MTEITIRDPAEPANAGYWSIEVVEQGDLLADMNISPDLLPDFDDPEDIREFGEAMIQVGDSVEEMEV